MAPSFTIAQKPLVVVPTGSETGSLRLEWIDDAADANAPVRYELEMKRSDASVFSFHSEYRAVGAGTKRVEIHREQDQDTPLSASFSYQFRVRATDGLGSATSYTMETTPATPKPPGSQAPITLKVGKVRIG